MHAILAVTQEAEAPGVIHSKIVSRNTSKPGWEDTAQLAESTRLRVQCPTLKKRKHRLTQNFRLLWTSTYFKSQKILSNNSEIKVRNRRTLPTTAKTKQVRKKLTHVAMFFRLLLCWGEHLDVFPIEFYRKVFTSHRCADLSVEFICHHGSLSQLRDYCSLLCLASFRGRAGRGQLGL